MFLCQILPIFWSPSLIFFASIPPCLVPLQLDMEKILKRRRYNAAYNRRVRTRQKQVQPSVMYNFDGDFDSDDESKQNSCSSNTSSVLQDLHVSCQESSIFNESLHPLDISSLNSFVDSHFSNDNSSLSDTSINAQFHHSNKIDPDCDSFFSYAAQSSDSSESEDENCCTLADDIRQLRQMDVKGNALDYVIDMFR